MDFLEQESTDEITWEKLGDLYEITRKPKSIDVKRFQQIPFIPMDSIPQGGAFYADFAEKSPNEIKSGTYFEKGDLLIAKITPCFENGKQALTENLDADFGYATTEVIPIRPKKQNQDKRFLFYYLLHPAVRAFVEEKMEGATGRQRVPETILLDLPVPKFDYKRQKNIGDVLFHIRRLVEIEKLLLAKHVSLKRASLDYYLSGSFLSEVPTKTQKLESVATVISTRMSYSELLNLSDDPAGGIRVLGIKVSDMNIKGNEHVLNTAAQSKTLHPEVVRARCAPPGTIIFPKRGAAIGTNKKRISSTWTVFDPNVIGVVAGDGIDSHFLFQWFQKFDLRSITEPGPTPQLNKKNLIPLEIVVPVSLATQKEVASILGKMDRQIELHYKKIDALEHLFTSVLDLSIRGKIDVDKINDILNKVSTSHEHH